MAAGLSRRRLLAGAATIGAVATIGVGAAAGMAQALTPQQALERLFGAGQIDSAWFSPTLLQQVPPAQLRQQIGGIKGLFGQYRAVEPQGDGSFRVTFAGGRVGVRVSLDEQGRITGLRILSLDHTLAADEQELRFTSGGDTLYGTLLLPAGAVSPPAALLIAGSGPTDRNGNSPLLTLPVNTLAETARALASAGVASLRYDKLGAGKTGLAGRAPTDYGFGTFLDEALAAYDTLAARAEVNGARLLVGGHSEGGLFALLVAQQRQAVSPPTGLLLEAPLARRGLDVLRRQLVAQAGAALASGEWSRDRYDLFVAEVDRTIAGIRQDGTVPPDAFNAEPGLRAMLFGPGTGPFLQEEDSYDPAQIAATLPPSWPVLLLHGGQDRNVDGADVQHLLEGFQVAGNTSVEYDELAGVDHELRRVPEGQQPSLSRALPFSPNAATAITAFAARVFG